MLQPDHAEALGLLAPMPYCEARRPAQIDEAERCLLLAAQQRQPGSFQLESTIHSAHCQHAFTGQTPRSAVANLNGLLVANCRSTKASTGHAVARAEAGDVPSGLMYLRAMPDGEIAASQTYWVAGAYLERRASHTQDAEAALQRALGLTTEPRARAHLRATAQTALAK